MEMLPSRFDGSRFHNLVPRRNGFVAMLRWMLSRRPGKWYVSGEPSAQHRPPLSSENLQITFINHSTFLIQVLGINILTDPIWSDRAGPLSWAGPRRHTEPGISFAELPPIDLVLLSHNHYDHLDVPTLMRLHREHRPTIYTGLRNAGMLAGHGIESVVEMDWWQESTARADLWITAVPAQHFSGRTPFDRDRSLWCGFVVQTENLCVFFAGDTGAGPHIGHIAEKFPEIDVAILPIGAYLPAWFMGEVHMSPQQAVAAQQQLGARIAIASHFGTFPLADDGKDEPVNALREALAHTELQDREFWTLEHGESRVVPGRSADVPASSGVAD
jgi:L-ascorbate metabolism protein UlaG (beta-lactamase superfamily)